MVMYNLSTAKLHDLAIHILVKTTVVIPYLFFFCWRSFSGIYSSFIFSSTKENKFCSRPYIIKLCRIEKITCDNSGRNTLFTRDATGPFKRPFLMSCILRRISYNKRPYVNPGSFCTACIKLYVMAPVAAITQTEL
ncbi:hypothetical protein ACJIZ3_015674 [Penstemon smallii]|uniref:Uncharacterized protein n=1 Tax=Penstemon smallii TaxID=265156 RepID=A0ABD3RTL8_9LAMI